MSFMNMLSVYETGALAALSMFLFCYAIAMLNNSVPVVKREFMDPVPKVMRPIWPFVRIIAYYFCAKLPFSYLEKIEKRLASTGVSYIMIAEEFMALRIVSAIISLMLGFVTLEELDSWNDLLYPFLPVIGFYYPEIWLRDIRKRQVEGIRKHIPSYLDFLTMTVEAGLNLSGAMDQARQKGPKGPLYNEFGIVLRDIRSGLARAKALQRMSKRLDMSEITSFVNAVVQAEKLGSSLAGILRIQAEQRRNERFQRAEKKAMEAPVKLVGPLVLFIFPTTFMVLAFPIVMKFLEEGLY